MRTALTMARNPPRNPGTGESVTRWEGCWGWREQERDGWTAWPALLTQQAEQVQRLSLTGTVFGELPLAESLQHLVLNVMEDIGRKDANAWRICTC